MTDTLKRAWSVPVCFESGDVFSKPGHDDKMIRKTCISVDHNNEPKGAKYVRVCYARKYLQSKRQQAKFWKLINEANDRMQDETTKLLDAQIPKEAVHLYLCYHTITPSLPPAMFLSQLHIGSHIQPLLSSMTNNFPQSPQIIVHHTSHGVLPTHLVLAFPT
jgi:hypothetical protein